MEEQTTEMRKVISCKNVKTRDWTAWNNRIPPKPDSFHVTGEVLVPNPGVTATLTPKEPQGINPKDLLLDLNLIQEPGIWPQVQTWVTARYDKVTQNADYDSATVFCKTAIIEQIDAENVEYETSVA